MQPSESALILKDEVYQIVGAAMEVHTQLGCGFLESVYQEALGMELHSRGIPYVPQARIGVAYKGQLLESVFFADFLCFDSIILELKAIKTISGVEEAQLFNYLKATNLPVGLILNFGARSFEWKRYANTRSQ
jgi:GxxExxY protein